MSKLMKCSLTLEATRCSEVLGAWCLSSLVLFGCGTDQGVLFADIDLTSQGSESEQGTEQGLTDLSMSSSGSDAMTDGEESAADSASSGGSSNSEQSGNNNGAASSQTGGMNLQGEGSEPNDSAASTNSDNLPNNSDVQETVRPEIVSVVPENNAVGIGSETTIVINFSVGMNRTLTQAAYQSESLPSGSVDFSWNDASTQLTITPREPLQYSSGSDPDEVQARRVNFFVSASAEDAEGNAMTVTRESSFSLLREIRGELQAVQDRDLSGSYRSNDTYGGGQCSRDEVTICVGDSGTGDEVSYRGFVTFDLDSVPALSGRLASAQLAFEVDDLEGEPFILGGLQVDHTEFDEIGLDAFNREALAQVAFIEDPEDEGFSFNIDVLEAFRADIDQRPRTQYRLSFEIINDEEEDFDAVVTTWDSHSLEYSFLIP